MNIAKISVAVLSLALAATPASAKVVSFPAHITTEDPHTKKPVTIHGTTTLSITKTPKGVIVREHFIGSDDTYDVFYRGQGKFAQTAKTYVIPISGEWEGWKSEFQSKGTDRIFASDDGLTPTGDSIVTLNNKPGDGR